MLMRDRGWRRELRVSWGVLVRGWARWVWWTRRELGETGEWKGGRRFSAERLFLGLIGIRVGLFPLIINN